MAHGTRLESLIKSFSAPALDLVQTGPQGIGLAGGLHDALMAVPRLALEGRRLGIRGPVPRVTDTPESRLLIDRIAEDGETLEQAAALLSGETDGVAICAEILIPLLRFVPALPVPSIAALHEPLDMRRRAEVWRYLADAVKHDRLPVYNIDHIDLVNNRSYADFNRLPGGVYLLVWQGNLPIHAQKG